MPSHVWDHSQTDEHVSSSIRKRRRGSCHRRSPLQRAVFALQRARSPEAVARREQAKMHNLRLNRAEDKKRGYLRSFMALNNGQPTGRGGVHDRVVNERLAAAAATVDVMDAETRVERIVNRRRAPVEDVGKCAFLREWTNGELADVDAYIYEHNTTFEDGTLTDRAIVGHIIERLHRTITRDQCLALLDHLKYDWMKTTGDKGYYFARASEPATLFHRSKMLPLLEAVFLLPEYFVPYNQDEMLMRARTNPKKVWARRGDEGHRYVFMLVHSLHALTHGDTAMCDTNSRVWALATASPRSSVPMACSRARAAFHSAT